MFSRMKDEPINGPHTMATLEEDTSCKSIHQKCEAAVPECTLSRWQAEGSSEPARPAKDQGETNLQKLERMLEHTKRRLEESEASREQLRDEKEELENNNNSQANLWSKVSSLQEQNRYIIAKAKSRIEKVQSLEAEVEYLISQRDELYRQAKGQGNASNEVLQKTALQNEIAELRKDLKLSANRNENLADNFGKAKDLLETKDALIKVLQRDKSEAWKQLDISEKENRAVFESFEFKEKTMPAEINEAHDRIRNLLVENATMAASLDSVTSKNVTLNVDFEAKKTLVTTLKRDKFEALKQLALLLNKTRDDQKSRKLLQEAKDSANKSLLAEWKSVAERNAIMLDYEQMQRNLKLLAQQHFDTNTKLIKHNQFINILNAENARLQSGAIERNKVFANISREAREKIEEKITEVESLKETSKRDLQSSKVVQDNLRSVILKMTDKIASLLAEKAEAEASLEAASLNNDALLAEIERLKTDLGTAINSNNNLIKQYNDATDALGAKSAQQEDFCQDRNAPSKRRRIL